MNTSQEQTEFHVVSDLSDMMCQSDILESYKWISAKMLQKWRREGRIRCFNGMSNESVYPKSDILEVLNKELKCPSCLNIEDIGSTKKKDVMDTTDIGTITEEEKLGVKNSLQVILKLQKTS